jgi:glycosyltransferase involved in cell wall biosynthesis
LPDGGGCAGLKVLHIIPSVGPLRGGPSVVARSIAEALVNRGLSVDIATTDDNGTEQLTVPLARPVVENGVTFWYFPRQISFYTVSWPLCQWLAAHVGDYDLVHIHGLFSFATTVGAFWATRRGVPYLLRPLGALNNWGIRNRRPFLKTLSLRLIERRILANAAAAHFTSDRERCEAELIAPGIRSVVIPNPVAVTVGKQLTTETLLSNYPELAGKRIVLFLSRLDPIKGLDLLLDGFAKIQTKHPETALIVAGSGDEDFAAQLREHAHQLGIERDVVWAGFLEGDEKRAAFAAADVFVLASYSENFGVAVVEAMASGLPVIVSDQVGIHREIAEAKAGLIVRCDANEVSDAVVQMLSDGEARHQISRNAALLAKKFSPEVVSQKLIEVYRQLFIKYAKLAATRTVPPKPVS